ncbi:MAG TPA: hypothetical protein VKD08_00195 [Ignavibacteriaceae bacterium]|nr:hypothetical protein [Ignavibacteriaceae bacterium]
MKKKYLYIFILAVTLSGCSVYQSFVNLSRLQFKLGQVNGFTVNGVSLAGKSKLSDFSSVELLRISQAVANGTLPVSFVLNVQAKNPNDGTGGYPSTNATIRDFPWRLLINDKETISGGLKNEVTVPGTGEISNIPLQLNLDLLRFFKDKGYQDLINLALAIGGNQGSSSNLTLYAQPTVSTSLGPIKYPNELKIVNVQFTNK